MNEIVNKFLLAGDEFMPEMHIRHFHIVLAYHSLKAKREYNNLKN